MSSFVINSIHLTDVCSPYNNIVSRRNIQIFIYSHYSKLIVWNCNKFITFFNVCLFIFQFISLNEVILCHMEFFDNLTRHVIPSDTTYKAVTYIRFSEVFYSDFFSTDFLNDINLDVSSQNDLTLFVNQFNNNNRFATYSRNTSC